MDRQLRFFTLGIDNRVTVRYRPVHGTAVENSAVYATGMQTLIKLFFLFAFGKERRMANSNAVGKGVR